MIITMTRKEALDKQNELILKIAELQRIAKVRVSKIQRDTGCGGCPARGRTEL